jgi:aubergine-like protein
MTNVDAGKIKPGQISFGSQPHDLNRKSMFDREAQSGIFSKPNPFDWAILSCRGDRDSETAKNTFINEIQKACQRAKIEFKQPVVVDSNKNANDYLGHMNNLQNAQFFVCILPTRGKKKDDMNLYKLTKRLAINELGVPTQVVLSKTLTNPKGVTSIVSKILTQIIAKLNNGAPWGLVNPECSDCPTMVCGIDVWHGAGKSLLGFTASLDNAFSK